MRQKSNRKLKVNRILLSWMNTRPIKYRLEVSISIVVLVYITAATNNITRLWPLKRRGDTEPMRRTCLRAERRAACAFLAAPLGRQHSLVTTFYVVYKSTETFIQTSTSSDAIYSFGTCIVLVQLCDEKEYFTLL